MPFLTLLDDRAKIKGSRDPLGFQLIWTRLGRQVIENLTTVTASVRGFTTLLLGLYFAQQIVEQRQANEADLANIFLKFEQLAAYSRVINNGNQDDDPDILGIRRVKRYLSEKRGQVRISAHQDDQILSNQKTYGLWGLYTVAARNSGLIEPGYSYLTTASQTFVEAEYLSRLDHVEQKITTFLIRSQVFEPTRQHKLLAATLAKVLGPALTVSEIEFYAHHLLFGGKADAPQHRLWNQIKAANIPEPFSMPELKAIIKCCQAVGDVSLALRLEYIQQVEQVIAPAGQLFGYILSRDNQPASNIVRDMRSKWGNSIDHLDPAVFTRALDSIEDLDPDTQARLTELASALQTGQYEKAIILLLAQNKAVMQDRGSSPWVTFKNNQLDVRLREEDNPLPAKSDLPNLWLNTYFINSLKLIGSQLYH